MLQMTDGTILVENSDDIQTWMKLTPDANGSYINGTWSSTAAMNFARLYFGSQVLPSGRLFVVGGEYTGVNAGGSFQNFSNTAEIYDPVANTWTVAAPYPNQANCPFVNSFTANQTNGSNILTNVYPQTAGLLGKTIIGFGIPVGTTVTSIDSATQVHISQNATSTSSTNTIDTSSDYALVACFGDDPTMLIPGGTAGVVLAGDIVNGNAYLYDIATNSWTPTAPKIYNDPSDEEGWTKLADGTILTYDLFQSVNHSASYAEKYNPSTHTWSSISPSDGGANGTIPVLSSTALGFELGPMLRLEDGRVFVIGANQHTALYTPATNTWAAGPDISGSLHGNAASFGGDDAPAAILPNGHVIFAADAGPSPIVTSGHITNGSPVITGISSTASFYVNWSVAGGGIPNNSFIVSVDSPTQVTINASATATGTPTLTFGGIFSNPLELFDFNPSNNTISPVSPALADANLPFLPAFVSRMLMLPTGQMLFSDSTNQLYIYTPDGAASPAMKPVINGVAYNGGGVFTLTGKQLNGQSAGAAYGDDNQMDSNYPIVRMVNGAGNVFYATTSNWSNFNVGQSSTPMTVNFTLSPNLVTPGTYSVFVSGAGISSTPVFVNITQAEINKQ